MTSVGFDAEHGLPTGRDGGDVGKVFGSAGTRSGESRERYALSATQPEIAEAPTAVIRTVQTVANLIASPYWTSQDEPSVLLLLRLFMNAEDRTAELGVKTA
jgi:hypothetical protein